MITLEELDQHFEKYLSKLKENIELQKQFLDAEYSLKESELKYLKYILCEKYELQQRINNQT